MINLYAPSRRLPELLEEMSKSKEPLQLTVLTGKKCPGFIVSDLRRANGLKVLTRCKQVISCTKFRYYRVEELTHTAIDRSTGAQVQLTLRQVKTELERYAKTGGISIPSKAILAGYLKKPVDTDLYRSIQPRNY